MIDFIFWLMTAAVVLNLLLYPMARIVDVTKSMILQEPTVDLGVTIQELKANLIGDSGLDAGEGWELWLWGDLLIGACYWAVSLFLLCTSWFWWVPMLPLIWLGVVLGGRYYVDNHNKKYGTDL